MDLVLQWIADAESRRWIRHSAVCCCMMHSMTVQYTGQKCVAVLTRTFRLRSQQQAVVVCFAKLVN